MRALMIYFAGLPGLKWMNDWFARETFDPPLRAKGVPTCILQLVEL